MEHVRVDQGDGVAVITLVDVQRRNAMTATMVGEIVETFDRFEADDTIGAVVITGEAPAFCSGADVSSLGARGRGNRRARTRRRVDHRRVPSRLRSALPTCGRQNSPDPAPGCCSRATFASAAPPARFCGSACTGGGHVDAERAVARRPPPRSCCSANRSTATVPRRSGSWRCVLLRAWCPPRGSPPAPRVEAVARGGEAASQVQWRPGAAPRSGRRDLVARPGLVPTPT